MMSAMETIAISLLLKLETKCSGLFMKFILVLDQMNSVDCFVSVICLSKIKTNIQTFCWDASATKPLVGTSL